jgi:glycerol uptake facilitator-like aquaporin
MAILKILLLTVVVYIIGALWFSKLFGKTWMKIHHNKDKAPEDVKKDMKGMWKLMLTEFILTFVINFTLFFIASASDTLTVALISTFIIWLGFILPTTVSNVIWGGDNRKWMIKKIAISSGYRLIAMLITVWILFVW